MQSLQLYVWREIEYGGVTQCVSIWTELYLNNSTQEVHDTTRKLYNAVHLVVIFWLPLLILSVCYVLIIRDVYKTLNASSDTSSVRNNTFSIICSNEIIVVAILVSYGL